jgi:hypothetical protein
MLKFLIQTINGRVVHDFTFTLERALEYMDWREIENCYAYCQLENMEHMDYGIDSDDIRDYVPIGTVEFVLHFCELFINQRAKEIIKPINVPTELFPYAGRMIKNVMIDEPTVLSDIFRAEDNNIDKIFVKSNDTIKDPLDGLYCSDTQLQTGNYQLSSYKNNICSEYRIFIYKDEIRGIQFYSGDCTVFPNIESVKEWLKNYRWDYGNGSAPEAFTLDVFIDKQGNNGVMEVHDFFSCGLYGFSDYSVLPYMFVRAFQKIKRELK